MKSTITSLGHAGLDLRLGSARVVCDPWLSPRGAYLGGWHQFPGNDHLAATDLHDTPTIVLSSPRPDHFDLETLRGFPKTPRVILPKLASPALAEKVRALGFSNVVELGDGEPVDLGDGARLSLLASPAKHLQGSTLVVERAGEVVVVQNDCLLDEAALDRIAALKPALHFLQFSGSSYFPAAYDLAPDRMQEEVAREVAAIAQRFFDAATRLGARHVVPSGGPPCFVDERGFELNFGGSIFFDADELVARAAREASPVREQLRLLYPGDVAALDPDIGGDWTFGGRRPYDDKREYLESYRRARAPLREAHLAELRAEATPVDSKDFRSYLRDFFQFEDMTAELKMIVEFRLTDGPSVWVDFRNKPYRYQTECADPAAYVLSVESAWVSLVLQGKVTWHELLMGRQVTITRDPAREAPKLMQHFDYRHDQALFDLVRLIDPALITLQDEKMEYVCQRFCPHRGRDLEYAVIERGVLTCTAHGWRFDLRKGGRCLWGGETPLLVKEVRPLKL
jgi:nitrite reductase/ring-hydroxylating ferredoxin subunit